MNADWLQFDQDAGLLLVTNRDGKTCRYVRGTVLQSTSAWDIEVNFAGGVIRFDEHKLRALPEQIVVKRLAETNAVTGTPKLGTTATQFEYLRQD